MNLVKEKWTEKDTSDFLKYLESIKKEDKIVWTRNLLKTDMEVLAIPTSKIRDMAKEILKGNYKSFLELKLNNYYDNIAINGFIVSYIKDFDKLKQYLDYYVTTIDSWALTDLLKFNIKGNEINFWNLSQKYIKSKNTFTKRTGIVILFHFVNDSKYIFDIFKTLNKFKNEGEYYVNMINAWLLCECFIKHRKETLEFFNNNNLNDFTLNKAIQKCRESNRVSKSDKEYLRTLKKSK